MKSRERIVARQRLDKRFEAIRNTDAGARPAKGWIRAIRNALGMTTTQLAKRMGVSQPQVVKTEQSEARRAISLESLERAADALGCDLVYTLVPRQPLRESIVERARQLAVKQLSRTTHTMPLEAQNVSPEEYDETLEELVQKLVESGGSRLWESD